MNNLTNRELYLLTECTEWQSCSHGGCKARREIERLTRERDQARAELNSTNGHWPEIRRLRAERTGLHGALVRVRLEVSGCPPDCSHDFHRLAIKSAFKIANDALKRSAEPSPAPETKAARDVLAERRRQVESEGWTPEHDDEHEAGELAKAASCYALCASVGVASLADLETVYEFVDQYQNAAVPRPPWPWLDEWWKPKSPRRDLVRAGALILAEIERPDRLSGAPSSAEKAGDTP